MKIQETIAEMPVKTKISIAGGAALLVLALVLCIIYTSMGCSARNLSIKDYANVGKTDTGDYEVTLDLPRLIEENYLPDISKPEVSENLSDYPELEILARVSFGVRKEGEGENPSYIITAQLRSEEEADQEKAGKTDKEKAEEADRVLRRHGILLINTGWDWSEEEIQAAYEQTGEYPRKLDMRNFVIVERTDEGTYSVRVNHDELLVATRWRLPSNATDLEAHEGYRAIMDVTIDFSQDGDTYILEIASTRGDIEETLLAEGVQLVYTSWTWTQAELEDAYYAQSGATRPPETAEPEMTIEPELTPEGIEQPTPEPTLTPVPTPTPTVSPSPTPTASPTPAVTATPSISTDKTNSIQSLQNFDQTEVRKTIRAAKEKQYGSLLRSSEVIGNYFVVQKTSAATYANCFRLVYKINLSSGTKYVAADIYNVHSSKAPAANSVFLREYSSASAANTTADFASAQYTVQELTGGSMVYPDAPSTRFSDGRVFPKALKETVSYAEMWKVPQTSSYTLLQLLGYARNELFAEMGHDFKSGTYYDFYSQFAWYQPTREVSTAQMMSEEPAGYLSLTRITFIETLIKEG